MVTVKARDRRAEAEEEEAAIEKLWRESGNLHILADRVGMSIQRGKPPPKWVHRVLLNLADTSRPAAEVKRLQRNAVRFARYVAVREAHDREGLSWEDAREYAAKKLRGHPAEASADYMWKEYKAMRAALRKAGVGDDDPGYRSVSDEG
jgi:hypothetical protein